MRTTLEGQCHCGAVKVTVPSESFGVVACHCGDCQKLHGNFFAMVAVDRAEARFDGKGAIGWYDSSEKAKRSFCIECGSRLAKDPYGSPKVLVSVGLFERAAFTSIKKHVMSDLKPAWYEVAS